MDTKPGRVQVIVQAHNVNKTNKSWLIFWQEDFGNLEILRHVLLIKTIFLVFQGFIRRRQYTIKARFQRLKSASVKGIEHFIFILIFCFIFILFQILYPSGD